MKLQPTLCLANNEVGNGNRTIAYIQQACLPISMWFFDECSCSALDDDAPFVSPEADPAPWYVADNPESGEFLGVLLDRMDLQPVAARSVVPKNSGGGIVGRMVPRPRTLEVTAWMFASSCAGMAWGQRWLADVLNGSCGGCSEDTAEILPSCPADDEYDPERFFRTLHRVGMTEGPSFTAGEDACYLQEVSFTLVAGEPYLFAPAIACLEAELATTESECCLAETLEWNGDATLRIVLEASSSGSSDIDIEVRATNDGYCPAGPQMPCVSYHVDALDPYDRLTIDGVTREVILHSATSKSDRAGLGLIDFDGMFFYPDIGPCAQMCVCVTNNGANSVTVTVEQYNREF